MFSVFCFPSPVLATKTFTKLFDLFQQSRQLLGSESASLQTVNDSPKDRAKFHTGLGCANALIANGVPCAIALHTVLQWHYRICSASFELQQPKHRFVLSSRVSGGAQGFKKELHDILQVIPVNTQRFEAGQGNVGGIWNQAAESNFTCLHSRVKYISEGQQMLWPLFGILEKLSESIACQHARDEIG